MRPGTVGAPSSGQLPSNSSDALVFAAVGCRWCVPASAVLVRAAAFFVPHSTSPYHRVAYLVANPRRHRPHPPGRPPPATAAPASLSEVTALGSALAPGPSGRRSARLGRWRVSRRRCCPGTVRVGPQIIPRCSIDPLFGRDSCPPVRGGFRRLPRSLCDIPL